MSRAQVSLEFLILVAAFLAFLAAWLPVLGKVKAETEQGIAISFARESAARLAGALDDVCMLGEGNVRLVDLNVVGSASVEGKGKRVFIVGEDYAVSANRICHSGEFGLQVEGPVRLRVASQGGLVEVEAIN